jgi:probable HAF family extracellular repeat protein
LLSGGIPTDISVPGAVARYATGINQLGQIVGYYSGAAGDTHGFLYSDGTFSTLDVPGAVGGTLGAGTYAYGINAQGQIVGTYLGAGGFQSFLATPVPVPEPASLSLLASGVVIVLAAGSRAAPGVGWPFRGEKRGHSRLSGPNKPPQLTGPA